MVLGDKRKKDLRGKTFNRLTVLRDSGERNERRIVWDCICSCGNFTKGRTKDIVNGDKKSCGCLVKEKVTAKNLKHGYYNTPLYNIWNGMKARCRCETNDGYKYYGGRGILVCDEWIESFPRFRFWALLCGYQEGLSIDRINNDGNYEPNNCQWLTMSENSRKGSS